MKVNDRVYALIRLGHHSGRSIPQYERGTVLEYTKPKSYSVKTGFGREKRKTSGRAKVRWDNGLEGYYEEDQLGS